MILIKFGLLLTTIVSIGQNYWQQTAFNYGGQIDAIVVNNCDEVIAGKNDKMFKSDDHDNTWTQIIAFGPSIRTLAKNRENGYLYAGLDNSSNTGAVYKSVNGGSSWAFSGLSQKMINNIVVAPNGSIFAACSSSEPNQGGVYKSLDHGNNWTLSLSSLYDVYSLAVDNAGNIYAGTQDVGSSGWGQVLKSSDNGITWGSIGWFSNWGMVDGITITSTGVILIHHSFDKIFRLADGGTTWAEVLSDVSCLNTFAMVTNSKDSIYIVDGGVRVSHDYGLTWESINSGLTAMSIRSLALSPDEYLYSGSANSSIFRSNQPTIPTGILQTRTYPLESIYI